MRRTPSTILAVLATVLFAIQPAQAAKPTGTGSDSTGAPESTAVATQTLPLSTDTAEIGPYWNLRWGNDSNPPHICVNNMSQFAMQTATEQWDYQAHDLFLVYQDTDGDCLLWSDNERIDVENGYNPSQACGYTWYQYNSNNQITRMILYLNATPERASCWSSQIRKNHFASKTLGLGLGNRLITTYCPCDIYVMRAESFDSISWAQPADGRTFDWYN
jgi:hypothetical protein